MKRKCLSHVGGPRKKAHVVGQSTSATSSAIEQPVLQRFYPRLLTLRRYVLLQLPKSSKNRRRKLAQLGWPTTSKSATSTGDTDIELGQLLDSTVVGEQKTVNIESHAQVAKERNEDVEAFTQQLSPATIGGTLRPGYFLQSEVGRVTWQIVARSKRHKHRC